MNYNNNFPDGVTPSMCDPYRKEDIAFTCDECGRDILYYERVTEFGNKRYCQKCVENNTYEVEKEY